MKSKSKKCATCGWSVGHHLYCSMFKKNLPLYIVYGVLAALIISTAIYVIFLFNKDDVVKGSYTPELERERSLQAQQVQSKQTPSDVDSDEVVKIVESLFPILTLLMVIGFVVIIFTKMARL